MTAAPADQEAAQVLAEVARRQAEVEARPRPARWQVLSYRHDQDERDHGPRFSGPAWFGTASEAGRVRKLRALRRLEGAGLVACSKVGGRLHVKLTAGGRQCAAELELATAGAAAGAD